ncbi:hypothetical protein SAMN06296036_10574 [Pseudobacteriovorax antillogorgiicola]|uniref:Uncharacterized protein n=1 Tax=Pseudobacteriovorax antillogorgiicola TaxID=1513793 RepID=A0A1Y6BH23_9BACT|nr:hypothetical protein EDD56_105250 [Pseudobacteriovorax antillogorgiicola]SMF11319.1 hypothetical protein SAMN06296036_10574 [Pseudobacteriovorax antillogorgiicola]
MTKSLLEKLAIPLQLAKFVGSLYDFWVEVVVKPDEDDVH